MMLKPSVASKSEQWRGDDTSGWQPGRQRTLLDMDMQGALAVLASVRDAPAR